MKALLLFLRDNPWIVLVLAASAFFEVRRLVRARRLRSLVGPPVGAGLGGLEYQPTIHASVDCPCGLRASCEAIGPIVEAGWIEPQTTPRRHWICPGCARAERETSDRAAAVRLGSSETVGSVPVGVDSTTENG